MKEGAKKKLENMRTSEKKKREKNGKAKGKNKVVRKGREEGEITK